VACLASPNGVAAALAIGVLAFVEFRWRIIMRARPWLFVAGLLVAVTPFMLWVTSDTVHRTEFLTLYTLGEQEPLSNIPVLELARYSDFLGMPSGRLQLPVRIPYRLHVVLALLASILVLYRYNRGLLQKLACLILPCMAWWAYIRNPSARYMAIAAPYSSLLLAGGALALWNQKPAWRRKLVGVVVLLLVAQVASNYALLYIYRKADYTGVTSALRALIPRDATVYGALTFWMALNDHQYYSWNRTSLPYALDHGATYLILNDRVLVGGEGHGRDDWRIRRLTLEDFVKTNASLIGRVPNPFYGDLQIYHVNSLAAPPKGR
jgi:hypothetical protein